VIGWPISPGAIDMPPPPILVVAGEPGLRRQIADLLLASEHLVFCARTTAEAIDFELSGLRWRLAVFGGAYGAREAASYSRWMSADVPVIVVRSLGLDFIDPSLARGEIFATTASLVDVVEALLGPPPQAANRNPFDPT
jgi:hypothetical protein